ncbi:class I SAM-dependent methyltransferase [Patescibacteria group bacterium]|nr:class I SAM-dependent methyltransferase [Patescibacteria group bacterium]
MKRALLNYFYLTYRRRLLDRLLFENIACYQGRVLDIGGRNRGLFKKPKDQVQEWVFADIVSEHCPDIVVDVMDMNNVENESFDVVNATELFEHVLCPEKGLRECFRVLKPDGTLVLSAPFLHPIHADPSDYQRWTKFKWQEELAAVGFKIEKLESMGHFFTVWMEMFKVLVHLIPIKLVRWLLFCTFPLADLIVKLDSLESIIKGKLGNYTTGYFIICRR